MLITYTGKISGKVITVPVNYVREGNTLYVLSPRDRVWWKNLRGGAPVTVWARGREMAGTGEVQEDAQAVEAGLLVFLRQRPVYGKYYHINLTADGQPDDPARVTEITGARAVIRVQLAL